MRILFILTGICGTEPNDDIKKYNLEHLTISIDTLRIMNGSLMPYLDTASYIDDKNNETIYSQLMQLLENRMTYGQTTILDITSFDNLNDILDLAEVYRYKVIYVIYERYNKFDEKNKNIRKRKINNIIPYKELEKNKILVKELKKQHKGYEKDIYKAVQKWDRFVIDRDTFNNYDDICVIPDLHGCYGVFSKFLEDNNILQNKKTAYIFLGDYIDRGEDNTSVIESIIQLASLENVYLIMGNHDLRLFNWAFDKSYSGNNFKKTIEELEKKKSKKEIENIKKSLRKIHKFIKDYMYFEFSGQKYFINHAGIEKIRDNIPACCLNGKKTYGYFDDKDSYESYIFMAHQWKSNHPDIIQIFGHRNCFPLYLKDSVKINENAYCLESNVEYGDPLTVLYLKDKKVKTYDNPAKDNKTIKNNIKNLIQEKEYEKHNLKSITYTKNIFHKKIWDRIPVKANEFYEYIDSGKIAGRSYNKFFHIGEHTDIKVENLIESIEYPVNFYKKYNGFTGLVFYNETTNKLEYAAKTIPYGEKYNKYLEELLNKEQKEYIKEISRKYNVTFIFECMHLKDNIHPVKILKSELILLDIIENQENEVYRNELAGNLFSKKELLNTAHNKDELLKLIEYYSSSLDIDFEGVVLQDKNNKMVKISSIFYMTKKCIREKLNHTSITPLEYFCCNSNAVRLTGIYLFPFDKIVPIEKWQDITTDDLKKLDSI